MKKVLIAFSLLVAAAFFGSQSVKAAEPPAYVRGVCNINGQLYSIDQDFGIYSSAGVYMGQLEVAATPSGWIAIRTDGVQFPVFGCRW